MFVLTEFYCKLQLLPILSLVLTLNVKKVVDEMKQKSRKRKSQFFLSETDLTFSSSIVFCEDCQMKIESVDGFLA